MCYAEKKASFWPHTDAGNLPMIRSNANPSAFPCSTADIRRRTSPLPENTAAPLPAAWPESARKTEKENSLCLFRIQEVRGESGGVQRCQTGRHAQAGQRRGCVKARRSCGAGAAYGAARHAAHTAAVRAVRHIVAGGNPVVRRSAFRSGTAAGKHKKRPPLLETGMRREDKNGIKLKKWVNKY